MPKARPPRDGSVPPRPWTRTRIVALLLAAAGVPTAAPLGAQQPAPVAIALERRLARELGLAVGDTLRVGASADEPGHVARVAAIYQPATDPASVMRRDLRVRLHLPDLAALLGQPDRVDRFGVALAPGTDPGAAARRLDRAAFGFRAAPSAEVADQSSQTFRVVSRFHKAIGAISVAASAIFLLCIMLLKVEERRRDAAVLRFVGIRRRTIFRALLLEAGVMAVAGAVLGVAFAWAAAALTNLYYQRVFETGLLFALVTPGVVAFAVGLSLVLGVGAGAIAAWRLARTPPMVLWGRG